MTIQIFGPLGVHLLTDDTHAFKHCGGNTEIKDTSQKQNKKSLRNWFVYFSHQHRNDVWLQTSDCNYLLLKLVTVVRFYIV
jgi:hypothetical protein